MSAIRFKISPEPPFSATRPRPIEWMAVKQYCVTERGALLASAEGAVWAHAHRITGVVVAVQRRPSWRGWRCLTAPMRKMQFSPDASA